MKIRYFKWLLKIIKKNKFKNRLNGSEWKVYENHLINRPYFIDLHRTPTLRKMVTTTNAVSVNTTSDESVSENVFLYHSRFRNDTNQTIATLKK